MRTISLLKFLLKYMNSDFYEAVEYYYEGHDNLEVVYPNGNVAFVVTKNQNTVKEILRSDAKLGYHYSLFTQAIGNKYNLTNPELDPKISSKIHQVFSKSILSLNKRIPALIKKYIHIMFENDIFVLDTVFEKFMLSVWSDYIFGTSVNFEEYVELRTDVLKYLKIFYDTDSKFIPIIGSWMVGIKKQLNSRALFDINGKIVSMIKKAGDDSLIETIRTNLEEDQISDEIIQDNIIVFIMIYDFLANVLYNQLVKTISGEEVQYGTSVQESFLFQYRSRIVEGTLTFIDLKETHLYHSTGPRMCIGVSYTKLFLDIFWTYINRYHFKVLEKINTNNKVSKDVPMCQYTYKVEWYYKRNIIPQIIPSYNFKGLDFYHVLGIYENVSLTKYIVREFRKLINVSTGKIPNNKAAKIAIVSPEMRGIPIAAHLAMTIGVPLYVIRKPGKTPGPIYSIEYNTAYSTDIFEISQDTEIDNKNLIFIDDGISSGGTVVACNDLITKNFKNTKIIKVLGILNHTYRDKEEAFKKFENITHTLFDL